jgi:hypothetical protein
MLGAHRLPAVRICLVIVSVVLWSASVSAFAASSGPSQASGKKSSSARRAK